VEVSIGRKARFQGSAREGPESGRKPPCLDVASQRLFAWLGVVAEDAIITPQMVATLWSKAEEESKWHLPVNVRQKAANLPQTLTRLIPAAMPICALFPKQTFDLTVPARLREMANKMIMNVSTI
jgi:hypothetical protein